MKSAALLTGDPNDVADYLHALNLHELNHVPAGDLTSALINALKRVAALEDRLAPPPVAAAAPDLLAELKAVEWAGTRLGPGYEEVGCCPRCRGIDPNNPESGIFVASEQGHRPGCTLAATLAGAGRDVR